MGGSDMSLLGIYFFWILLIFGNFLIFVIYTKFLIYVLHLI